VIALLEEVVFIRVIELDGDLAISSLLAKESASMRSDFLIDYAVTSHKELRDVLGLARLSLTYYLISG
jgi:hypothetical protein